MKLILKNTDLVLESLSEENFSIIIASLSKYNGFRMSLDNGTLTVNSDYYVTEFIPVSSVKNITFDNVLQDEYSCIAYYNNTEYLGYELLSDNLVPTIPSSATKFRLCININSNYGSIINYTSFEVNGTEVVHNFYNEVKFTNFIIGLNGASGLKGSSIVSPITISSDVIIKVEGVPNSPTVDCYRILFSKSGDNVASNKYLFKIPSGTSYYKVPIANTLLLDTITFSFESSNTSIKCTILTPDSK